MQICCSQNLTTCSMPVHLDIVFLAAGTADEGSNADFCPDPEPIYLELRHLGNVQKGVDAALQVLHELPERSNSIKLCSSTAECHGRCLPAVPDCVLHQAVTFEGRSPMSMLGRHSQQHPYNTRPGNVEHSKAPEAVVLT